LTGVGGWLLFFVIVMFFNALLNLAISANAGAGAIFTLPLAALAVITGVQLSRKQKSGVLLAKIFLYANFCVAVLAVIGAAEANDATGIVMAQCVLYLLRSIVFGAIWLGYLYRSKRVKNTYGL